jgi:hypothetical protein
VKIQPLPLIDLDEVDAHRFDIDQQLAVSRDRFRHILELENLRPARFVYANRPHHQLRILAT